MMIRKKKHGVSEVGIHKECEHVISMANNPPPPQKKIKMTVVNVIGKLNVV